MEDWFRSPMIILSLMVLPLLAIDFFIFHDEHAAPTSGDAPTLLTLYYAVMVAYSLIWCAFLLELLIKVSIAQSRFQYLIRNWLDVVIIVLPVIPVAGKHFLGAPALRSLRLVRTLQLFTLRGVGMKLFRSGMAAVVGMKFVSRVSGEKLAEKDPLAQELERLSAMSREELMNEVFKLKERVQAMEERLVSSFKFTKALCEQLRFTQNERLVPDPPDALLNKLTRREKELPRNQEG